MTDARPWILFDIGGVLELVDDGSWQRELVERWAAAAGLSVGQYEARVAAADLPPIDVVTGRADEYWRRWAGLFGFDDDQLAAFRAEFWDVYCGDANTELIAYASSLRSRTGVAILSNSADGAREEEERRFGFSRIFDPICYSHEQGANKPDPPAYERALERMGARPDDVFFIDDRQEAIDGAAACGIAGIVHADNATTMAAVEEFLAASIGLGPRTAD